MKRNLFNVIDWFVPNPKDPLAERIGTKHTISSLENLNELPVYRAKTRKLSYAILLALLFDVLGVVFFFNNKDTLAPDVYEISAADLQARNSANYENKPLLIFDTPRHTETAIERWLNNALNDLYNFDYLNFEERIDEVSKYFTDAGFVHFVSALQRVEARETIKNNNLTINTVVFGRPLFPSVYGNKKISDGNLYYHIIVPMRMIVKKNNAVAEYDTTFRLMLAVLVDNAGKTGFYIQEFDMSQPKRVG